jgi:hypothetical protein
LPASGRTNAQRTKHISGVSSDMTHLIINNATDVSATSVVYAGEKVVKITVSTEGAWGNQPNTITIYDLPAHVADALEELLGKGGVKPAPQP